MSFFGSCLNEFQAFHISFNMDVFTDIISFLVFFSGFRAFKPKIFCAGLLSAFMFSFLYYGFEGVPHFFSVVTFVKCMDERFISSFTYVADC